jgi:hypothetical protein
MIDHETDEDYRYVVKVFNERLRLAVVPVYGADHDANQWALQRKRGNHWASFKFFARASHVRDHLVSDYGGSFAEWAMQWAGRDHLKQV